MTEKLVTIRLPASDVDLLVQACAVAAEVNTRKWRKNLLTGQVNKERAERFVAIANRLIEALK